jgi:hypothetical protein
VPDGAARPRTVHEDESVARAGLADGEHAAGG